MRDKPAEQLSAMVDDELKDVEVQLLLARMRENAEYGRQWERFHLASEAIRNGLPDRVDTNLAARVAALVDAEPPLEGSSAKAVARRPRLRPATGFAVAASLTAAVALGVKFLAENAPDTAVEPTRLALPNVSVEPELEEAAVANLFVPPSASMESKMYPYLRNHNEQASRGVGPKVLPLGRMVGYEIER